MSWNICPRTVVAQHMAAQFVLQERLCWGAVRSWCRGMGSWKQYMPSSVFSSWGQIILDAAVRDEPWPRVLPRSLGPLCLCFRVVQPASRCHQLVQWRVFCGSLLQRGRESARLQAARWLSVSPLQECLCGICLLETRIISLLEARGQRSLSADRENICSVLHVSCLGDGCRLGCLSGRG